MNAISKTKSSLVTLMLLPLAFSGCFPKVEHSLRVPIPTNIDTSILNKISHESEAKETTFEEKANHRVGIIFKNFERIDVFDFKSRKHIVALISYRENMPKNIFEGLSAKFTVVGVEDAESEELKNVYDTLATIEFIKMDIPSLPMSFWGTIEVILTLSITIEKADIVQTKTFTEKSKISGKFTGADFAGIAVSSAIAVSPLILPAVIPVPAQTITTSDGTTVILPPNPAINLAGASGFAQSSYEILYGDIEGYCPGYPQMCRMELLVGGCVQKAMCNIIQSMAQLIRDNSVN